MRGRREEAVMFELSSGWVWFASGLTLTVAFALLAVVLAAYARSSERRHGTER
jgi:hypothetical protein